MNRAGEIDYAAPYVRWWYEVTALIASGRVKLASITYRAVEGTPLSHLNDGILTIAPMSASVIAALAGKRDANAEATILGITPPSA
jgi:hypothetical protein